jgi:hypothetical protein
MNQSWKNRIKDPYYNAKLVHAKDAHAAGCWVYSVSTKKLYTPREFMDSDEQVHIHRGKEDAARFKIVDPRGMLASIIEDIKYRSAEAAELQKRIYDYYEVIAKHKK